MTLFRLQSYRLMFCIGGDVRIYKADKRPRAKVMQMCSLILVPGDYPPPAKDRFGLFVSDSQLETLNEEEFIKTWWEDKA